MSKYTEMQAFYEKRIKELTEERDYLRERYDRVAHDSAQKIFENNRKLGIENGKLTVYKEMLKKLMGERANTTDTYFMFEGKVYRAEDYDLHRVEGELDRLTVEFVGVDISDWVKGATT